MRTSTLSSVQQEAVLHLGTYEVRVVLYLRFPYAANPLSSMQFGHIPTVIPEDSLLQRTLGGVVTPELVHEVGLLFFFS